MYKKAATIGIGICVFSLAVILLLLKPSATPAMDMEPERDIAYYQAQLLQTFPVGRDDLAFPAFLAKLIPPNAPWQYLYAHDYEDSQWIMAGDTLVEFFAYNMLHAYPAQQVQEWLSQDQQAYQVPLPAMQAFLLRLFAYVEDVRVQGSGYYQADTDIVLIPASLVNPSEIVYADISAVIDYTTVKLLMEWNVASHHLDYQEGDKIEEIFLWFRRDGENEVSVWCVRLLCSDDRIQLMDMTDFSDEPLRRGVPQDLWQEEGRQVDVLP